MGFQVLVDDNFHYQDASERETLGEFDSYEAAVAACKQVVDGYLASAFEEGMGADQLYRSYCMFGTDPFIVPEPDGERFSARKYARLRCDEIFGGSGAGDP